jgi:DNA polymerase III sliding clamp (beta) subunit (PCNA family)
MKFHTTAGALSSACTAAELAARTSAGNVATIKAENGRIIVVGSDGEISTSALVAGEVLSGGTVAVPAKPIATYCSTLVSATRIDVAADGGELVITAGTREYRFPCFDERPAVLEAPFEDATHIFASGVDELLATVRHAVDTRTQLVKLSGSDGVMRMYATDTYRLCVAETATGSYEGDWSILAPVQTLLVALRHAPESLRIDQRGRLASFSNDTVETTVRLSVANFPAVEPVLQTSPANQLTLDAAATITALNRLNCVAGNEPIRVAITSDSATLSVASGSGRGSELLPVQAATPASFGVTAKYLHDAITACKTKTITVAYGSSSSPIHVKSTDIKHPVTCVIMPAVWDQR